MTDAPSSRSPDYRYTVDVDSADITPLAAVQAHLADRELGVLNISLGGVALIFDREPTPLAGEVLDISISIREHAFPVQVDVRGTRGLRLACAFQNPPRAFQNSLREFLKPKFLGRTLARNPGLSARPDVLALETGATQYEAFLGQNQMGVFVWSGPERELFKLVAVSQDLMFEWSRAAGLRTGRMSQRHGLPEVDLIDADLNWSRFPEPALVHYFADILLAWLNVEAGPSFIETLLSDSSDAAGKSNSDLRFPVLP